MAAAGSDGSNGGGTGGIATATSSVDPRLAGAEGGLMRNWPSARRAPENLCKQIADLKAEQIANRIARAKVQKDLKNAQRRRRRLKTKVRQLTNEDLLAVMVMRSEDRGEAAAGAALAAADAASAAAHDEPADE